MMARIIAVLMVAICSFTTITANAQRANVTVRTPGTAVHVDNGRSGYHKGNNHYRQHNRYDRRRGNFHRRHAHAHHGHRMHKKHAWTSGHRSHGRKARGHHRMMRR